MGRLKEVQFGFQLLLERQRCTCPPMRRAVCEQWAVLQMSRAIGEESKLQKEQAESLEDLMEKAKVELKRGMRRLNRAFQQSKSNHLLYLVLFCIAVFAFLYVWAKFYRLMKWIR